MTLNKHDAMLKWLDANPGKEKTDWLLEVRCKDDRQREEFKEFLEKIRGCGHSGDLEVAPQEWLDNVCVCIPGHPKCVRTLEQSEGDDICVEFDFRYGRYFFDLDTPDSIFDNVDPQRPQHIAIDYLEWKASQLGLENTTFVMEARERFSVFKWSFRHWRELV